MACPSNQVCNSGRCEATSGSAGGGSGGGAGSATFSQWCQSFASTYCDALVSCGYMDGVARPACLSYFVNGDCFQSGTSIAKGYSTFDAQAANSCLASLQLMLNECSLGASACTDVTKPASTNGAGCISEDDCTDPNSGCGGAGVCARTCSPAGGANQPCIDGARCNSGLYCDSLAGLCKTPQPAGSTCTASNQCDSNSYCDFNQQKCVALPTGGQPCTTQYQCASTAYCDFSSQPYTCRVAATIGQPCSGTQCTADAYCDYSLTTPTCAAKKQGGSSCTSPSQCASGRCEANICRTPASEGQPCRLFTDCQTGLYCDDVSKVCTRYALNLQSGATCTGHTLNCSSPYVCKGANRNPDGGVGTSGTCGTPALNDACRQHYECPRSAYCSATDGGVGACQTAALGTSCGSSYNCLPEHYCNESAAGITCASRVAANQPCNPSSEDNPCVKPNHCVPTSDTTAVCKALGTTGSPCFPNAPGNSDCSLLHECVSGQCQPVGLLGQPCLQGGECLEGACTGADAGVRGTCGAPRSDGARCSPSNASDCAGFCDSVTTTCATCN